MRLHVLTFDSVSHLNNECNWEQLFKKVSLKNEFRPIKWAWIFVLFINDAESSFPVLCFLLCIMGQLHIWTIKTDFDTCNFVCMYEYYVRCKLICNTSKTWVAAVCILMLASFLGTVLCVHIAKQTCT